MAKKPVQFWALMSAGAASILGILGGILIVLLLLYRLFTNDWDNWSFFGMLRPLIPAGIFIVASLVLMFVQSHLDVEEENRDDPFK